MEGCGNRQRDGAANAMLFANLGDAIKRRLVSGQHNLCWLVVVGDLADIALGGRVDVMIVFEP